MANRARSGKSAGATENPATDETASVAATENGESEVTVTDQATDVVATADEAVNTGDATAQPEKSEVEEVIDLSQVNAALDAILASDYSDPSTVNFDAVITAYQNLSRKGKAAATREMGDKSTELLEAGDFAKARIYLLANKATKATPSKSSAPKTPADQTRSVVERLAGFQLSYATLMENLPEGVATEGLKEKVQTAYEAGLEEIKNYLAWENSEAEDKSDAPELSGAAELALKISFKATRKPYGKRHDVTAHIEQIFADKAVGTFLTATQISKEKSEEYGDDEATASAITARLKSDKPLPSGLTATERDGTKGVLKESEPVVVEDAA